MTTSKQASKLLLLLVRLAAGILCAALLMPSLSSETFFFPVLVRVPALPSKKARTYSCGNNERKQRPPKDWGRCTQASAQRDWPVNNPTTVPREPSLFFFSCASCKTNPYQPRNSTAVSTLINGQTKTKCASSTYSVYIYSYETAFLIKKEERKKECTLSLLPYLFTNSLVAVLHQLAPTERTLEYTQLSPGP